jgi:hypothetical protein
LPSSSPPPSLRSRTESGKGARHGLAGGVPAGGPVLAGGQGMGKKRETAERIRFTYLPWAGVAQGGGSAVRFGRRRELAAAARLVAVVEQGGLWRLGCEVWSGEGPLAPIYRRRRRVREGRFFSGEGGGRRRLGLLLEVRPAGPGRRATGRHGAGQLV